MPLPSLPSLLVDVDFANAPTSATRTWTDVSAYVRGFSSRRGRQTELDQITAGTARVAFSNGTARFNPDNSAGPYYGFLKPMRPIRVRARWDPSLPDNLLTANQASIETNTAGWAVDSNCTIARTTAQAADGSASLELTATGTPMRANTSTGASGVAVSGSTQYTALLSFRAATSTRSCQTFLLWYDSGGAFISSSSSSGTDVTTGWTQVAHTATSPSNAAYAAVLALVGPGVGVGEVHYVDKASIHAGSSTSWYAPGTIVTYPVFSGFVTSWPQEYPGTTDAVVTVACVDAFRFLANRTLYTTYSAEKTGTRIGNVLTDAGWPTGAAHRDVDTGLSTVQAETLEETALSHILACADSEGSVFYMSQAGVATFLQRDALLALTFDSNYTWADAGVGWRYRDVILRPADDATLWNAVKVAAPTLTDQTATDATSITNHFRRDLTLSTLLTTTNEMADRAQYAVTRYANPATRVERIDLNGMGDTGSWPYIFNTEIGELIKVIRTPSAGDAISQLSVVEGIEVTVDPDRFDVSFSLSPADGSQDYLILDDATNGQLDSNRLSF